MVDAAQPGAAPAPAPAPPASGPTPASPAERWQPASPAAAVPPTVVTSAPRTDAASARLVAILKDGSDGQVYPLTQDQVDVGSHEGDVVLRDDPYMSPRHARICRRGDTFVLRDLDSTNGVYVRIRQPVDVSDGDMILIGQEVLRFEALPDGELPLGPASVHGVMVFGTPEVPRVARLVQYATEGVGRDVYYLYRDETVLGRENGDIVFTDDPFLSRRHASVTVDRANGRFVLRDLGSSNGTAVRLRREHALEDGDQFRMGRHLFRFDRVRVPGGRQPEQ
jgi:pSer/pThr/pTyr-binding forkhead associated (FHA) protein